MSKDNIQNAYIHCISWLCPQILTKRKRCHSFNSAQAPAQRASFMNFTKLRIKDFGATGQNKQCMPNMTFHM